MNSPNARPSTRALTAPDRRHHPRYTVQGPNRNPPGRQRRNRCALETTDLSRGGCYIQLIATLSLGARLQATLWLDGYPIVIQGRVVTRHPQFGNGIMFLEFEAEGDQLLKRYLEAVIT
jgi:hypothetical protein